MAVADQQPRASFAQIVAALSTTYKSAGVAIYLRSPNKQLNGATPLQFIEAGDIDRVAEVVARIDGVDPVVFRVTDMGR